MEPIVLPRLRRRRRWGQRLLFAAIALVALFTLGSAIALAIVVRDIDAVRRFDLAGDLTRAQEAPVSADRIEVLDGDGTGTGEPLPPPGPAENFLLVGSDNASEIDASSPILIDREENEGVYLADTIMLLRVRPEEQTAYLLSIPRDLNVDIPGLGSRRINSAFNLPDREAGAGRLIDTIEDNFGIAVQHYVEVDLAAFTGLVDSIGGVDLCFEYPARNPRTGFEVGAAGMAHLDGETALEYVRSRAGFEEHIDGRWVPGSGSDLERIARQQEFLGATIDQALDGGILSNPAQTNRIIGVIADIVTISNTLDIFGDGLELAGWFRDFGSDRLTTEQLAVESIPGSFQLRMTDDAEVQLDRFRGIDPDSVVPKRVTVTVVGADQAARESIAGALADLGFVADPAPDAARAGTATGIRFGVGGVDAAVLTAAHLDGAIEWTADPSLNGNEIVVELPDMAPAVLVEPRALPTGPGSLVPATTTPLASASGDAPPASSPTTAGSDTSAPVPSICG